jgi:CRISPR/Cas system-associated endonuclease Cas1
MGTLYIDRKDLYIKLDGHAIAFYANGERKGTVPVNPLKRVIIIGHVSIETPVLHKLVSENVSVLFLSGKRLRFCGMLHGRLHNNGILRVNQYQKSLSAFAEELPREIEVIGLDPTIGFLHRFEYGRESLACDLVELYRTDVDRFVRDLFRERTFSARDFALNDERPGCYLKKESRQKFYPRYEDWAKAIRPEIVKEVRALAVRIMDGQDIISE